LIGAGGGGTAIAGAVASQHPRQISIFDLDRGRVAALIAKITAIDSAVTVKFAEPTIDNVDILMNASPTGMLGDQRRPIEAEALPKDLIVFDAIVMPEATPLLTLAEQCGCVVIRGREMMHGQIERLADYFEQIPVE
jgi:shikimate dehydrogenase